MKSLTVLTEKERERNEKVLPQSGMCTADITGMRQRQESKYEIYDFVFSAAAESLKQNKTLSNIESREIVL